MEADEPLPPLPRTIKTQLAERGPAEQGTILLGRNAKGWAKGQWDSEEAVRAEPEKVVPGSSEGLGESWGKTPAGEHGRGSGEG